MGRPPMKVGARGPVSVKELPKTGAGVRRWRAVVRVRDRDGVIRQVTAHGPTQTKARQALEEALAERSGPNSGLLNGDTRYRVLAEMWMVDVQRRSAATTYDTYRRLLDSVVLPRFGELRLRETDGAAIAFALEQLAGRYTPNGLRQIRKVMAGPLEKAREMYLIDRNPARDLGQIRGKSKPARALTPEEQATLLRFVDSDDKAKAHDLPDLIRFLLGSGCRIGEALGMRWADLDLERGRAHVSGSIVRVKGQPLQRAVGKTDAANRHIYLPASLVLTLQMRWDGRDMIDDLPVFSSAAGTWRDLNNVQRMFRYVRDSVPGLEWMTSHTFRRTVATMLDEAGLTPREIADHLGHSRPSMSMDTYMARGDGPRRAAGILERSAVLAAD